MITVTEDVAATGYLIVSHTRTEDVVRAKMTHHVTLSRTPERSRGPLTKADYEAFIALATQMDVPSEATVTVRAPIVTFCWDTET